jgi:hypothetical protein
VPGFPAHDTGVLRLDDIIVTADGVDLAGFSNRIVRNGNMITSVQRIRLREVIISRDPGEHIELTIIRPLPQQPEEPRPDRAIQPQIPNLPGVNLVVEGPNRNAERLEIRVPLGSFELLSRTQPVTPAELDAAWRLRARRLGIPDIDTEALAPRLPPNQWAVMHRARGVGHTIRPASTQSGASENVMRAIAQADAGNAPPVNDLRGVVQRHEIRVIQPNNPKLRDQIRQGPARPAGAIVVVPIEPAQNPGRRQAEEIEQITFQMQDTLQRLQELRDLLADPQTAPEVRAKAREKMVNLEAEAAGLAALIDMLRRGVVNP